MVHLKKDFSNSETWLRQLELSCQEAGLDDICLKSENKNVGLAAAMKLDNADKDVKGVFDKIKRIIVDKGAEVAGADDFVAMVKDKTPKTPLRRKGEAT